MRHASPLEIKSVASDDEDEVKAALTDLTASTKATLDKIATEVRNITKRQDEIEKKANRSRLGGHNEECDGAAERKALGVFVRTGNDSELKSMSVGSDPDGGYVVHPVISQTMIKKLFDQSPMRRLARTETITTGDAWEEPIDKDEVGATWVGETEGRTATATAQLGVLRVLVHEIYALQPITQRLLDDSSIDIGGWVEGKIGDKFARAEGAASVNGNGIKKPRGFMTYPMATTSDESRAWGTLQYVKSGHATQVTADALRNIMWSLRGVYRQGASWLMNSNTANQIDLLKDGNGQYLWRNGMTVGAQPSLLGYPVEFSEDLADIGAGTVPIAFGNWKLGYLLVDKAGIRFLRDPFSNKPNVLFYAYRRSGGDIANFEAIKALKIEA